MIQCDFVFAHRSESHIKGKVEMGHFHLQCQCLNLEIGSVVCERAQNRNCISVANTLNIFRMYECMNTYKNFSFAAALVPLRFG